MQWLLAGVVWGCFGVAPAALAQAPADEYRLKAAVLYKFAQFTEWPSSGNRPLGVCVQGRDPFGPSIDALQGQAIGQRRIEVQRKTAHEPLRGCDVLFIAGDALGQLPQVLEALRGAPVLTVADSPGAVQRGVMLNMTLDAERISFEANLGAARAGRLRLDARLLQLASRVQP